MKFLLALIAAVFLVAVVTRAPNVQRLLRIILVLLAIYAFLKMTGVIEAIAPGRQGQVGMGYYNTIITWC